MVKKEDIYLHVAIWHPLDSEGWPGERVRIQRVIEERRMLLPNFVLLKDALLFKFVSVVNWVEGMR